MVRDLIHHATTVSLWREAEAGGSYTGSPSDRADGFLHFSTSDQIVDSVERHRPGGRDLMLLSVDPARLGKALRWEPSRRGLLFPHLYGALPVDAVAHVDALPLEADGRHRFPDRIEQARKRASEDSP